MTSLTRNLNIAASAAILSLTACGAPGTSQSFVAEGGDSAELPRLVDVGGEPPACRSDNMLSRVRAEFEYRQRYEVESGRMIRLLGDAEDGGLLADYPPAALSGYTTSRWCAWETTLDNGETLRLYIRADAKPGEATIAMMCPTLYSSKYQTGFYDCENARGPLMASR